MLRGTGQHRLVSYVASSSGYLAMSQQADTYKTSRYYCFATQQICFDGASCCN